METLHSPKLRKIFAGNTPWRIFIKPAMRTSNLVPMTVSRIELWPFRPWPGHCTEWCNTGWAKRSCAPVTAPVLHCAGREQVLYSQHRMCLLLPAVTAKSNYSTLLASATITYVCPTSDRCSRASLSPCGHHISACQFSETNRWRKLYEMCYWSIFYKLWGERIFWFCIGLA